MRPQLLLSNFTIVGGNTKDTWGKERKKAPRGKAVIRVVNEMLGVVDAR